MVRAIHPFCKTGHVMPKHALAGQSLFVVMPQQAFRTTAVNSHRLSKALFAARANQLHLSLRAHIHRKPPDNVSVLPPLLHCGPAVIIQIGPHAIDQDIISPWKINEGLPSEWVD